ncbi:hypothetical protein SAMN05660350_02710 [Geodermatophilus obscurus]|uniref:Uncharacterized protein n=1 Tax=Geodermatophilus obscurus TaxID=1861 RepID=A0A1M7U7P0_9ACTN|nr:hypothetical protein SAMN05660350_02710 [Geodermatophilus obscurus]
MAACAGRAATARCNEFSSTLPRPAGPGSRLQPWRAVVREPSPHAWHSAAVFTRVVHLNVTHIHASRDRAARARRPGALEEMCGSCGSRAVSSSGPWSQYSCVWRSARCSGAPARRSLTVLPAGETRTEVRPLRGTGPCDRRRVLDSPGPSALVPSRLPAVSAAVRGAPPRPFGRWAGHIFRRRCHPSQVTRRRIPAVAWYSNGTCACGRRDRSRADSSVRRCAAIAGRGVHCSVLLGSAVLAAPRPIKGRCSYELKQQMVRARQRSDARPCRRGADGRVLRARRGFEPDESAVRDGPRPTHRPKLSTRE